MKLLSHTEFFVRNGQMMYMERPVTAERINAKKGLTLFNGSKRIRLPEGIYTLEELKSKIL